MDESQNIVRQPQVPDKLNFLDESVAVLGKMLEELENKLSPVTRDEPSVAEPREEGPALCPVAQRILDISIRINELVRCVDNLLSRLEV